MVSYCWKYQDNSITLTNFITRIGMANASKHWLIVMLEQLELKMPISKPLKEKCVLKRVASYNSTWIQIFCIQQHWKIKSTNSFISQIFVLKTFFFLWYNSVVVPTSSFSTLVACIITDILKHLSAHKAPMKNEEVEL